MAVRLADFASAYFDGVARVTSAVPADVELRSLLRMPEGVERVESGPGEPLAVSGSTLGVLALEREVDAPALASLLGQVGYGGVVFLLLGWPVLRLPWHGVLDAVVAADLQVVEVVTVAASRYPTVAALRRDRRLTVPPPYLGRGHHLPAVLPVSDQTADRRLALRMAGELAFVGLRERRLRIVADEAGETLRQRIQELAAARQELEQAQTERAAEGDRAARAEGELGELRRSAGVRLGKALREARDLRGAIRLVRRAGGIRRRRGRRP
jgi:hypothetical protein